MRRLALLGILGLASACTDSKPSPPAPARSASQPKPPPPPEARSYSAPAEWAEAFPAARSFVPFDFIAYGECRWNHTVHRKICHCILGSRPKFVIVTGDLVDWAESSEDWVMFRRVTRELREKTPYYAAAGNHDVSSLKPFEKEFGLERLYYDKREGDLHLFFLDSNSGFSDAPQLRWLEETAGKSDALHKIAAFHHPPFGIDSFGDYESKIIREAIHSTLVRLKFCAAFCGHQHHFYTTRRDGIRYVITAGGGAPLYELDPSRALKGDLWRKFYHYVGCRFVGKSITAQVFDPDGQEAPELSFLVCEHP